MKNNTCHGQCYLMKKLKSQQEREQANFKVNFHEAFVAAPSEVEFQNPIKTRSFVDIQNLYISNLFPEDYSAIVFHPPVLA